jgi:UDP-2,3-diacylglucosamine pyrophosphatase LpxH
MTPAKDGIKQELIKLAHSLKRIPTSRDIKEHLELPRMVDNHWGSMEDLYTDVYGLKVAHKIDRNFLYDKWVNADEPVTLEFPDKKLGAFNYKEWLNAAQATQDLHHKASSKQDVATIKIASSKPVGIVFSADWHLGSISCDYKSFLKNHEFVLNTDGLYLGVVGDTIDNFYQFNNAHAILQQVIPPAKQRKLLGEIFHALLEKNKLLFVGYGNHETRDEKWFGDNLVARMVEEKIPYFSGKGIVKLYINEQIYTILVMHKTGSNSKINTLYGAKMEYGRYFPADIVVTGHTHVPAIESYWHYGAAGRIGFPFGGDSWLVKTGTYNVDDGFSKRFYNHGVVCDPTLVLFPQNRKIVPFMTAEDAMLYVKANNGGK